MIFNRLRLRNFKSHEDSVIDFTQGVNVIVGQNGAGKSTILEGISFALFKQHTAKKIDDLVKNNSNFMKVELDFDVNNGSYRIVREKRTNLQSTLFKKEGKEFIEVCKGDKEVLSNMEDILQMDSDLFLNAIYVRQGEIASLISKTPSEKKYLIAKLLGIDSLEVAWKNLLPYINDLEKRASELKGILSTAEDLNLDFEKEKQELESIKNKCEDNLLESSNISNDIQDIQKKMDKINTDKQYLESINNNIQIKENILAKYRTDLEKNKNHLLLIEESEEQLVKLDGCEEQLRTLQEKEKDILLILQMKKSEEELAEDIDKKRNQIKSFLQEVSKSIDEEVKSLGSAEKAIDLNINSIKDDYNLIEDKLQLSRKEKITLEEQKRNYRKSLDTISDIDGKCPVCSKPVSVEESKNLISMYNKDIEKCESSVKKISKEIEEITQNLSELSDLSKFYENLKSQLPYFFSIDKEMRDSQLKLQEIIATMPNFGELNLVHVRSEIEGCKERVKESNQLKGFIQNKDDYIKQNFDLSEKIDNLVQEIDALNIEKNRYNYNEDEYKSVKEKYDNLNNEYNELKKMISQDQGTALQKIQQLRDIVKKMEKIDRTQKEYDCLLSCVDSLNRIRDIYSKNGLQKELRNISRPLIEKRTKELFNSFNFNYSDLHLNEDYDVSLVGPEGDSSSNMISGGEKIATALSLRLGITQVISKDGFDTILLDEPTIHLDESRKYDLVSLFQSIKTLPQMIIVTHESQMENIADNFIVVKKINGISNVS